MKEPSLYRRKRPNSSKKLKLVCSFNGQFHLRPPSGKLCYIGGDTRIISVDRGIGFLRLRSKISELCPNTRDFSLKYRLPGSDPDQGDTTNLVLIDSDEDVRCMIDEYDKCNFCGECTRLRLFVCSGDRYVNLGIPVNRIENGFDNLTARVRDVCGEKGFGIERKGSCVNGGSGFGDYLGPNVLQSRDSESRLFGLQIDAKEIKNPATGFAGVRCGYRSLGEVVLKQQLLAENPFRVSSSGEKQKYYHQLVDLAPEALILHSNKPVNRNSEHTCEVSGNNPTQCLLRAFSGDEYEINQGISGTSSAVVLFPQLPCNSSTVCSGYNANRDFRNMDLMPASNFNWENIPWTANYDLRVSSDLNAGHDLRNMDPIPSSNFNRENMPWPTNYDSGETSLLPLSCSIHQMAGSAYPVKSDKVCGDLQCGIRNHRFGASDLRNHRMYYPSNPMEMGNNRNFRLDGRPWSGRYFTGLRPSSNISKQGQSLRSYHSSYWKPLSATHSQTLEGLVRMMECSLNSHSSTCNLQYTSGNMREQGALASKYGNPNIKECQLAYHGASSDMSNECLFCNDADNPLSTGTKYDFLTGSFSGKCEVPYHGELINCKAGCCDTKEPFSLGAVEVANISAFPNYPGYSKGIELRCSGKLSNMEAGIESLSTHNDDAHVLQGGIASPVDLSLGNLSLSSSKEVQAAALSSFVGSDVSESLMQSQSNCLDLMDEGYLGNLVKKSNGMESSSPNQNAAKQGNDHVQKEEIQLDPPSGLSSDEKYCLNTSFSSACNLRKMEGGENANVKESHKYSKVIGGVSSDLATFYSLLATRELQTIKNSDLEYIKELGSGTYGTVFYGKWKGSDVAIKRIKPSCFTEDALEEDRLVADFWKEAHLLGQLHHPNIVAFYGVVTDGPATNLATITEYMVNGSLKQVLRKKDRTIDRRKRLIIAMDAAFGMEYLHGKNIIHFDLKSPNFLMNMRDPQRPVCKIGDLGLSKIKQRTHISGGLRGTIPWMAPELLNGKNNLVTEKVDVYSFGIIMWELLTGEEPYGKLHSEEIIAGIIEGNLRPEIPSWCDPAWRSLMERCWASDPDTRPDFSEIAKELRVMSAAMNIK